MRRTGDPTAHLSVWARPTAAIAWPVITYGVVMLVPGVAILMESALEPSILLAWAMLGTLMGGPLVVVVALAAMSRERWIVGSAIAGRALWIGYAVGGMLLAHWLPFLAWSPLALVRSFYRTGYRSDEMVGSALLGLIAWVAVIAGGGMLAWTRWAIARRHNRVVQAWGGERPQWLMTAVIFGILTAPVTVGMIASVSASSLLLPEAIAVWLGLMAGGLAVAEIGAWSTAHAMMERARLGTKRVLFSKSFFRSLAASVAVHVAVVAACASLIPWGDAVGARFFVQMASTLVLMGAVGMSFASQPRVQTDALTEA